MLRRKLTIATLAVTLGASAAPAAAQTARPDPAAPPNATSEWLPDDAWVMQRWLPYSEARLMQVLQTDRYELGPWLRVGQRDLADLARRKGISPAAAIRRIMAPERSRLSRRQFRVRSDRARRTFGQRHLMQHMLFHNFHTWGATAGWRQGIGLTWREIGALRAQKMSLVQIAANNGRTSASLFDTVRRAVRSVSREGIRNGSTSRIQARDQLERDLAAVESYGNYRPGGAKSSATRAAAATRSTPTALCLLHRP